MPKEAKKLTAKAVQHLKSKGDKTTLYSVGGVKGLCLQCMSSGSRQWLLRYMFGTKRRAMGLGGYPDVSLAEAREIAAEKRKLVRQGIDPIEAKKLATKEIVQQQAQEITFDQAVKMALPKRLDELKNPKHKMDWENSLKNYASPKIGEMLITDISTEDVLTILQPIWNTKTDTAKKLQNRISYVLGWVIKTQKLDIDNPADWATVLKDYLPNPKKLLKLKSKHRPSLPYQRIAEFMGVIRNKNTMGAKALQFLILTGVRPGEVRGAVWGEINLEKHKWEIPEKRMKTGKNHTVYLSEQAIDLLNSISKGDYEENIFFAPRGGMLSDATLPKLIKDMNEKLDDEKQYIDPETRRDAVPHGFRATFKTWATEETHHQNGVIEISLSHKHEGEVEGAYMRGEMVTKRAALMQDWADFCDGEES